MIVDGDMKAGGSIKATAWYDDAYEKVDGLWRFRSRIVSPFTEPQVDALLEAT